jgi:hypothetical protein
VAIGTVTGSFWREAAVRTMADLEMSAPFPTSGGSVADLFRFEML